jgi:carbamoylphosphate synthase small subunit
MRPLPSFSEFSSMQMVSKMMPSNCISGNGIDVSSLMRRKESNQVNTEPFSIARDKEWYADQEAQAELEYYCQKHGIIGVGAQGKSAREILNRLKNRGVPQNVAGYESIEKISNKGLLYD